MAGWTSGAIAFFMTMFARMNFKALISIALVCLCFSLVPGQGYAQLSGSLKQTIATERATTTLAPAMRGGAPGGTVWFVFRQELAPEWHVYWRNPGDSGLPLELNWRVPDGFSVDDVIYPTPERIPVGPFVNYGHHGEPVFLAQMHVPEDAIPGETATITLSATWLICEEICVPESADFSITLPIVDNPVPDEVEAGYLATARAAHPTTLGEQAQFYADAERLVLSIPKTALSVADIENVYFFAAVEGLVAPSSPQVTADGDGRLLIDLPVGVAYAPEEMSALNGVLTFEAAGRNYAYSLIAEQAAGPAPTLIPDVAARRALADASSLGWFGIATLILAAFLGGIILNAMPCVFPIIFVKAASFLNAAGDQQSTIRRHGLIYTLGVLATFLALGGGLLLLRAGGAQVGWGFHLQSPWVVALSAYVLVLVGLNLAGMFEIGGNLQNIGAGLASRSGDAGAFFTGVLAVFVAAPCVGPFLSAPIGAAVILPPVLGVLIFLAMGAGLSAPYLALSFSPALAARLPKPGAWMKIARQALAFPVFAAAAYFVWVFAQQSGATGLAAIFAGVTFLSVGAWLYGLSQTQKASLRWGALVAVAIAIVPIANVSGSGTGVGAIQTPGSGGYGELSAVPFDEEVIAEMRGAGRGVFVDFTAAWCVVCQFNKATILSRPGLAALFNSSDIQLMSADWTRRDPVITEALAKHGANGVPLYVYFPPSGEPIVLPLPLTRSAIEAAINRE